MNNRYTILVVEDDGSLVRLLTAMLEGENYKVLTAGTCDVGEMVFASYRPDLILLDLGLPDRDGTGLIRTVRRDTGTPIIVLSARSDDQEKVRALDMGANDYVTKPFSTAELLARIRSCLRSSRNSGGELIFAGREFCAGGLEIDYDSRRVRYLGTEIHFTQNEYNILTLLARYSGKVLTYQTIIRNVWGAADSGSIKKLQVNMANIRKKLGIVPGEDGIIVNELGVGYRIRT